MYNLIRYIINITHAYYPTGGLRVHAVQGARTPEPRKGEG